MTSISPTTDFSDYDADQCQIAYEQEHAEQTSKNGGDPVKAHSTVAKLLPGLMARKKQLADDQNAAAVQNDTTAPLASIPQRSTDSQGLYRNMDDRDEAAVWKACGNSYSLEKASVGFDTLVNCIAKRVGSYPLAERNVRTNFKALSTLSDSQKIASKLAVELPPVNGGFSPKSGLTNPVPSPSNAKPLDGNSTFPNKTRSGLNAFTSTGIAPIANSAAKPDADEMLKQLDTPAKRKGAIKCLAAYLAHKNDTEADTAEKSIPQECPHMSKVHQQYLQDVQSEGNS
jgi:hypothetical protein